MVRRVHPLLALGIHLLLSGTEREAPREYGIPELGDIPVIQTLSLKDGAVVFVIGRRESGKTVLAYRLAEAIGRPIYAVSPEENPPQDIPQLTLEELSKEPPPYSTLILDDVPVYASQRDYNNPFVRTLEKIIPVVRHHRKLILIFNSQSSSLTDRYVLDSDLILLKPANMLFMDLERPSVAKLYKHVQPLFEEMTEYQQKRHAYLLSQDFRGMVRVQKRGVVGG